MLARVGGTDVTRQDVMAEARAQGRPAGAPLTPELVEAVVARTLLAQEARRRGIPHSANFPSDQRRSAAQVLATGLIRALPAPSAPTPAKADAFIAAHPERFAERKRLVLDELQYRVQRPLELEGSSFEDAQAKLAAAAVRFRVFQTQTIGADLPTDLQRALAATPSGRVAVWRDGDVYTAVGVAAVDPAPLTGAAAQRFATEALATAGRERQVRDLIARLRAREPVRIQPGFGS